MKDPLNIVVYIIREGILRLRCIRLRMTVESTHRTLKLFDFFVSCVCCDIVHSIALFLNHPTMPPKKSSSHPRIRIISIGGQGALIIDRLYHLVSRTIELVSIGLPSALAHAPHITTKIELPYMSLISNDPVAGAREVMATVEREVRGVLSGADMVFLVGNLATESNAYQVAEVANLARAQGILTCFVGRTAFPFEGATRQDLVDRAGEIVSGAVDGMIVVDSARVLGMASASEGLMQVNRVIEQAISMILDIVDTHGLINIDFADLKTTIQSAGSLFFHSVESDESNIASITDTLFVHPALRAPEVSQMKRVLYVIYAGREVLMESVSAVGNYIAGQVDQNARILFGVVSDQKLGNKVKIVLIGA